MGHKELDMTERRSLSSSVGLPSWLSRYEPACNTGDQILSLSGEDPLEEKMATHSSILAWRIPWTEEPGRLQRMGSQESDKT